MKKTILNWSTGKDAAYALYLMKQEAEYDVVRLSTTVQQEFDRVSMHGIRRELLLRQVEALEMKVDIVALPNPLPTAVYESLMHKQCVQYREEGIFHHAFGDILLVDLKAFREQQLERLGLQGVFPLWNKPTAQLVLEMIQNGFRAMVVCVNEMYLDKSFVGRTIDESFLRDLPSNVDPCGENGEFHTFVYDGPIFKQRVDFKVGELVYKSYDAPKTNDEETPQKYGFWFLDLL